VTLSRHGVQCTSLVIKVFPHVNNEVKVYNTETEETIYGNDEISQSHSTANIQKFLSQITNANVSISSRETDCIV